MSVQTAEPDKVVASAIAEISHIATLPEITLRIVELVEDPTSTAHDLHNVISNDPALCSRILKVVNSSFYGLPGQIGSINRAIVLLGLNAVKNIAISASLAKLFRSGQLAPNFSARDLWIHSIATATGAKLIADHLNLGASDEAFLAGLLHDIGVIVEMQYDRNKLIEVLNELGKGNAPAGDMREIEQRVFGADHQAFGRGLCQRWKFPASFANVCGNHHNPMDLPTGSRSLAALIHVADKLTVDLDAKGGFRLDIRDAEIDASVLDEIGLQADQLDSIRERLPAEIEVVESLLAG